MILKLITGPAVEPLTMEEIKDHLRIAQTELAEDHLLWTLQLTARKWLDGADGILNRQFMTATWEYVLQQFPADSFIPIPLPPLQSITSIKYKDKDGIEATMAASDYLVSADREPGRIKLAHGKSWPSATLLPLDAVRVRFVAGYADINTVPETAKHAMLFLIAHWYENREAVALGGGIVPRELPLAVQALLAPLRVYG